MMYYSKVSDKLIDKISYFNKQSTINDGKDSCTNNIQSLYLYFLMSYWYDDINVYNLVVKEVF